MSNQLTTLSIKSVSVLIQLWCHMTWQLQQCHHGNSVSNQGAVQHLVKHVELDAQYGCVSRFHGIFFSSVNFSAGSTTETPS